MYIGAAWIKFELWSTLSRDGLDSRRNATELRRQFVVFRSKCRRQARTLEANGQCLFPTASRLVLVVASVECQREVEVLMSTFAPCADGLLKCGNCLFSFTVHEVDVPFRIR